MSVSTIVSWIALSFAIGLIISLVVDVVCWPREKRRKPPDGR